MNITAWGLPISSRSREVQLGLFWVVKRNWELGCEALGERGHLAIAPPNASIDERAGDLPPCDVSWIVQRA